MTIKVTDYSKKIGKNMILDNINLEMVGGTVYGIKGINGSGKTMLMRAICGLLYPTSGSITVDGETLGCDISFPRSIGVLIEGPSFLGNLTGFQNLKLLASLKNTVTDEEISQTLKGVTLDPDNKKTYRKYSLGMKQKLGIAAAVMEKPDIVILDEPFNALDSGSAEAIKKLIIAQKERGALVIMSCHDTMTLEEMADEIIEIHEGRVVAC